MNPTTASAGTPDEYEVPPPHTPEPSVPKTDIFPGVETEVLPGAPGRPTDPPEPIDPQPLEPKTPDVPPIPS